MSRPELAEILVADPPEAWEELGFTVEDRSVVLGTVRIRLGLAGSGIVGLRLRGMQDGFDIDDLPMTHFEAPPPKPVVHRITAVGVDHVVLLTPDLARTTRKLAAAGFDHRPSPAPQEFFVLGPCLLELVERAGEQPRFWGLTLVVEDLDEAARQLGDRLGSPKPAVQPGRRIATIRAELSTPLALMNPRG